MKSDSHNKYYEQIEFWDTDFLQVDFTRRRIEETIDCLPTDITSVLDVGCGNGAFLNKIANDNPGKYKRLSGIDFSTEALKYVQTEKYHGNITNLPFKDKEFDLVISSEVLEHLTYTDFKKTVNEIKRVSKKYILIVVPNDEDLETSLVKCPNCSCWFNNEYHVRSFNVENLKRLLPDLEPDHIKEIGSYVTKTKYNTFTKLFFFYRNARLPADYSICPQCEFQVDKIDSVSEKKIQRKDNRSVKTFLKKLLLPSYQTKSCLLVLYKIAKVSKSS